MKFVTHLKEERRCFSLHIRRQQRERKNEKNNLDEPIYSISLSLEQTKSRVRKDLTKLDLKIRRRRPSEGIGRPVKLERIDERTEERI